MVFKKAIDDATSEWAQHHAKRFIDTRAKVGERSSGKRFGMMLRLFQSAHCLQELAPVLVTTCSRERAGDWQQVALKNHHTRTKHASPSPWTSAPRFNPPGLARLHPGELCLPPCGIWAVGRIRACSG